ncbi:MAG TPA: sensor histidine kinase [Thermoanaerobaculia bacterium]|nr:sensor histidine kinase [Thermoanaerobaculia bacterium]
MHDIVDRVRDITRENERLFQRLIEGERRFRSLARAVWKVQEEERRRLARELHDGLGQNLTALTNQLERLQQRLAESDATEMAVRLNDAVEMARLALNESRELSRLLRPPVLDDLGLPAALSWLARTLERTGLRVEVTLGGLDEARLDPDVETLVFRLVQEALTNVLRHAGVTRAQVALSRSGGVLALRVSDEGRGFDLQTAFAGSEAATGSGLRGMRDRLELFGGRLDLASVPGQGTVVSAIVPLLEAP